MVRKTHYSIAEAAEELELSRARMYQLVDTYELPTEEVMGKTAIRVGVLRNFARRKRPTGKNLRCRRNGG